MLENDVERYTKLSGKDGWNTTVGTIRDYLNGYDKALEKLDAIITEQIDMSINQVECQTLRWVLDKMSEISETESMLCNDNIQLIEKEEIK